MVLFEGRLWWRIAATIGSRSSSRRVHISVTLRVRTHQRNLHQRQHGLRDRLESGPLNHPNWRNGVRIVSSTRIASPRSFRRSSAKTVCIRERPAKAIVVDASGNVYAAEGPNSLTQAGGAFTKYR